MSAPLWLRRAWCAVVLIAATGCSDRQAPAEPRPLAGLAPGQPTVNACDSTDCICLDPPTAYERCGSGVANFPAGYNGSGPRTVVVLTDSPGLVHCWPATLCGDWMAENGQCPCTMGRYRETEMQARELTVWPDKYATLICNGYRLEPVQVGEMFVEKAELWIYGSAGDTIPIACDSLIIDYRATFDLRHGLDYWVKVPGLPVAYLAADADTVDLIPSHSPYWIGADTIWVTP